MTTREEMRGLAEEIVGSYEDRVSGIAELRETVKMDMQELRTHLEELRDTRVAIGREMRVDLARSVADRKREVGDMLKSFGAELKELSSVRSTMSQELKTDLAKSVADRKHEVGVMLKGFNVAPKEVRSELARGRDEWQKMTATMQSKRGGVAVAVKPLIEEITPETAALREQVFEYLANHPDGTRLVEIAAEFGVARIQIGKVIRNLMDENKVEKRDLLYFAV